MSTNYRTVTPTPHKLIICPQIVGGMTFLVLVLYLIVFLGMQRWNVPPLKQGRKKIGTAVPVVLRKVSAQ